jgi:hypothetical protein
MCKVDSNGEIEWENFYIEDDTYPNRLIDVVQMDDGGYTAVGQAWGGALRKTDVWVLRVDSSGCYYDDCYYVDSSDTVGIAPSPEEEASVLSIFPNPANEQIYISYINENASNNIEIQFYDIYGTVLKKYGIQSNEKLIQETIDISTLPIGTIICKLINKEAGTILATSKLIIVR